MLRNKTNKYLATSLDGWLVIKVPAGQCQAESSDSSDSDEGLSNSNEVMDEDKEISCGLEIKTPSSKKIVNSLREVKNLQGMFSACEFGSVTFKQLVYKPVLHAGTSSCHRCKPKSHYFCRCRTDTSCICNVDSLSIMQVASYEEHSFRSVRAYIEMGLHRCLR